MSWFYHACRALVGALFKFFPCEVEGLGNLPQDGPVLIISNHLSLLDPPLLGVKLGRKIRFMAKRELFRHKPVGYLIRRLGAFPVHRGRMDRRALRESLAVLKRGEALLIFPEGMRSRAGKLQRAFPGVTLIALKSRAPIVPVAITGTEKAREMWRFKRPRIKVSIGEPFGLSSTDGKLSKKEMIELTDSIMKRIAALLPSEYRGYYEDGSSGA